MPTRWTQTLIPTLREAPGDAEVPSHQLMLRAGFIRKLGSGSYTYMPLGLRSLQKAIAIIREEMAAAGANEIFMPTLQPLELWEKTGRKDAYGDNLFVVQDRHGRQQALGPTHEEVVTDLISGCVESYKDLPKTVYQIQTKFRDEFRPRFGVLRSREFYMKDAYSFHLKQEGPGGLDEEYDKQYAAYQKIFDRCGIPYMIVEAEAGPIGGNASHEFMVPSPTGEDTILTNDAGYAANVEKAERHQQKFSPDTLGDANGDIQLVETPDTTTVHDLCTSWPQFGGSKLRPANVLKTMVYKVTYHFPDEMQPDHPSRFPSVAEYAIWIVVVRGDRDVNEAKLRVAIENRHKIGDWVNVNFSFELIDENFSNELGLSLGYVGPDCSFAISDANPAVVITAIDDECIENKFWVVGGNKFGFHRRHFNWWRDFFGKNIVSGSGQLDLDGRATYVNQLTSEQRRIKITDIRNAVEGDPAPEDRGGGTLRATKGIEVGHVFKLGSKYTEALGVTVNDENNQPATPIMGCYGIGVNRILAAAIESETSKGKGHDENGIIWPKALAPFDVLITPIKYDGKVADVVNQLADQLETRGMEVLIDDRDERPGVKFKDGDLIGVPVRITVGDKGLTNEAGPMIELKARNGSNGPKGETIPLDGAIDQIVALLKKL